MRIGFSPPDGSSGWSSANRPQNCIANDHVGGAGMPANPAASAAAGSWYTGLSSLSAPAKFETGPRSMVTRCAPVGFPMTLLSRAMRPFHFFCADPRAV